MTFLGLSGTTVTGDLSSLAAINTRICLVEAWGGASVADHVTVGGRRLCCYKERHGGSGAALGRGAFQRAHAKRAARIRVYEPPHSI